MLPLAQEPQSRSVRFSCAAALTYDDWPTRPNVAQNTVHVQQPPPTDGPAKLQFNIDPSQTNKQGRASWISGYSGGSSRHLCILPLDRAVAGVESRLDQVLAGDPNLVGQQGLQPSGVSTNPALVKVTPPVATATPPPVASATPPPTSGRMTMQERLAMAMARGGNNRSVSPALGKVIERTTSPSPSSSPAPSARKEEAQKDDGEVKEEAPRMSEDVNIEENEATVEAPKPTEESASVTAEALPSTEPVVEEQKQAEPEPPYTNGVDTPAEPKPLDPTPRKSTDTPRASLESQPRPSIDAKPRLSTDSRPRVSLDATLPVASTVADPTTFILPQGLDELEAVISQLREDLAVCETRRAEETAAASERIDSLEEKLKYLSKESADEARKRVQAGGASALEKELAKRDERIALLLAEGQQLSKTELKHMNNIKRLRAKTQEEEKTTAEAKRKQEKAEKEAADLREKTKKAVDAERRANERLKAMAKMEVDNESLKRERDILQISTSDLKLQLAKAVARADDAESRVQTEALEAERKTTAELRDKLEKTQNDALAEKERYKNEVWTLQSKLERDGDRAKAVKLELENEISILETKLEVMRTHAEEASIGTSGHIHAKLLRQIETLQSQYAVASENWQGIEASLMSRLTAVEKERDDLTRKEGDVRKKAREINQKVKRLESDLESANLKIQDLESSLTTQLTLCDDLRKQITIHEDSKTQLTKKFDDERALWQREIRELRDSLRNTTPMTLPNDDIALRPKSRPGSILEAEGAIRPNSPNPRPRKQSFGSDVNPPYISKRMSRTESGDRLNEAGANRRLTLPEAARAYPQPSPWGATTPRLDSLSGYSGGGSGGISRQNSLFGGFGGLGMGISMGTSPSTPSLHASSVMSPGGGGTPGAIGEYDSESVFEGNANGGLASPGSHEGRNGALIGDMLSVSTVAAGPSVQLVERMSAAVRRLESEMASSREELLRMAAQRDEARAEVVELMTEVEEKRGLDTRVQALEAALTEKETLHEATLVMLGEKSEEVEELRNDVADLKQMYRDLIMSQTTTA
ncbi:LOW QUALITY PROTEIN: hypothetical protein Dda_5129 [Drechslerella dactyloides]|uniref:TATA element modulatory factor 1 TATA binding domain-containing protein n=1 Tax=Drechslerella dactyloides TaxID=74499 RepID=A0AAD6NIK2_DREDA|nr:LOW QUALITY PROTEIN: hypothetical protein Dda_5129 [Drechslerella dactyloides]